MSEYLKVSRNGQILEIVLDRPKANTIDGPLSRAMSDLFAESSDVKAGAKAFLEKRDPFWNGD